jgi:hypothetical protein
MTRSIFACALVLLLPSAFACAQFRTVTVQNSNSNPVPTNIQSMPPVTVSGSVDTTISNTPNVNIANTPGVNIANTPNVNATISGTPAVSITGTPAVSITNLPTGTAGPAATTALVTRNLDSPALQPFQKLLQCNVSGVSQCQASLTVPAGKQLVIEYVLFASSESSPGNQTYLYDLTTIAGGQSIDYFFAPGPRIAPFFPLSEHLVRIYADAGSTVTFEGEAQNSSAAVAFYARLSGYLVNVP